MMLRHASVNQFSGPRKRNDLTVSGDDAHANAEGCAPHRMAIVDQCDGKAGK